MFADRTYDHLVFSRCLSIIWGVYVLEHDRGQYRTFQLTSVLE